MSEALSIEHDFKMACDVAKLLPRRPTDDELLGLYGLYKQATLGDCNETRPFALDFKGRAKHDAWASLKGVDRVRAKKSYIGYVRDLANRHK